MPVLLRHAAGLHGYLLVSPDALFQEYCIADTPINQTLTRERLPIDADGFLTVPTEPGLGITLDDDVMKTYRVD